MLKALGKPSYGFANDNDYVTMCLLVIFAGVDMHKRVVDARVVIFQITICYVQDVCANVCGRPTYIVIYYRSLTRLNKIAT